MSAVEARMAELFECPLANDDPPMARNELVNGLQSTDVLVPTVTGAPRRHPLLHIGSASYEGRKESGARVIANIRAWVDGHCPPDQVLEGWV